MAHSNFIGDHFRISSQSLTLFKLQGMPSGKNWIVGISLVGDDNYMLIEVSPAPALADVLKVIEQDKADGNLDQVYMVAVSNRVAIRLWLEGVLKSTDESR